MDFLCILWQVRFEIMKINMVHIYFVVRRGFPFQNSLRDLDLSCDRFLIFGIVLEEEIPFYS